MKIKVFAIIALLCGMHTIYVLGSPLESYRVLQKEENRTEVEVLNDCDIVVANIAPVKKEKIYGDKVENVTYGGVNQNLFLNKQVEPNKSKKGIKIHRKNNRVILSVEYASLENEEVIQIISAVYLDSTQAKPDNAGYFPGDPFYVSLIKSESDEIRNISTKEGSGARPSEGQTDYNNFDIQSLKESVERLSQEVNRLENKSYSSNKDSYDILFILIALFVGLHIGFFLFYQNRKILKELSKDFSDTKTVVDNLVKKKNFLEVSSRTTPQDTIMNYPMSNDDIKSFIIKQIEDIQAQLMPLTPQPTIVANPDIVSVSNSEKKEEPSIDTDNVKYHITDNFFSLEQTDTKIFRIYFKNKDYYYTIVDDSAIRKELIGMLQMFEGCITYQTTDGVAKRVEPVRDGKLKKEDNKFYVDTKLVVEFV